MKSDLPLQWSRNLLEKERNSTGSICKTGKFEIRGIAQRLRNRIHLDEIKEGDIIVENTYKKRTHQTRDAFLEALLPHDYPQEQIHYINYTKCEDVLDSEGHVNPEAFDKYSSLRFFSICPVNLIQIDDM